MTEQFLPLEPDRARKPILPRWKWIGLIVFAAVLLLRPWLPGLLVFFGWAYGVIVIASLVFRLTGYLKNKFFWRVRNRVLGSFVFVGVLPLVVLAGIAYLVGWVMSGQLAANYVEASLRDIVAEVATFNTELAQQIVPGQETRTFESVAPGKLEHTLPRFPRLVVRLSRRLPTGELDLVSTADPMRVIPQDNEPERRATQAQVYPAKQWLGDAASFEGFLRRDRTILLTSVRPLLRSPGYYLEVSAPLEEEITQRLLREKSIYAVFRTTADNASVKKDESGLRIEWRDDDGVKRQQTLSPDSRRGQDRRRMVLWWTLLDAKNYQSGKRDLAAFSTFYVPLSVLYGNYLSGRYEQGNVLLKLIYVLLAIFGVVEIASVIIGTTISRRITGSIHDMYQGMIALQSGNLQHRIPVRRNDQLGMLAHSFNQMTSSITRLLEEVSEKKRLEQELEIAREVQATLFPKQLPRAPGLDVFGGCQPARVVSGDYYDFIMEDDARLHFVVGDISGKGISAALMMANLQASMRNQLMLFKSGAGSPAETLADIMRRLNVQIYMNSPAEKYITLFTGRYDAERRILHYCNAGHLPPILLQGSEVRRLEDGGTVLGLFEVARFQAGSVELQPGAVLAVFTDGVTEAFNEADEEFGEERLIAIVRRHRDLDPQSIYEAVVDEVRRWQGNLKQHDDITLLIAKAEGGSE